MLADVGKRGAVNKTKHLPGLSIGGILLGPKPYGSDSYVDVVVPSEPHHTYLRIVLLLASSLLKACRVREVHFRFHGVTIVPEGPYIQLLGN